MTVSANSIAVTIPVRANDAQAESEADQRARRLALEIAKGNETAFAELYDAYHHRLFRFAVALTRGDETISHEVVQSAFLTAAAKLRAVESAEHLWNWLAAVTRQHLGKIWRQQRRDASAISMEVMPEHAGAVADRILEERLDAALLAMNDDERQVIEWFYFDGRSQKEIAETIHATPKAVSSRLERARAKLRSLLAQGTLPK